MFEISTKKVDTWKQNSCKEKHISLEKNLDCFIIISWNNSDFLDLAIKNILDFIIDKITLENTYTEFSIALENINSFIKTWKLDGDKNLKLDVFIGVLHENNFLFSNIWDSSCYLLKNDNELLELTSKADKKQEFSFISNWELKSGEIIIMSNKRILDYLSENDFVDWLDKNNDIENFNKNISDILNEEILEENISITSIIYNTGDEKKYNDVQFEKIINIKEKLSESKFAKILWDNFVLIKQRLKTSSKNVKNWIFLLWIIVSLVLIYNILSTIVWVTTQNDKKQIAIEKLQQAKTYIKIASENIWNPDNFELNVSNAEKIIAETTEQKILLNDIEKIKDDINILKKQFNKIEIFDEMSSEILYKWNLKDWIKIVKNNNKPYIINKKWIFWPILPNTTPKDYIFSSLETNEEFVDATVLWTDIILLTNFSKVIIFTSNWYFAFSDVTWQATWEKAKEIDSYWQNIYLLWKQENQILKHSKNWNKFDLAKPYLKSEDLKQIWEILSIAIDWGFYILKKNLSVVKFYSNPKYRLEKIVLNKLPKNYKIEKENSRIELKANNTINYVYILLNNKIWVFDTNTKNYNDTKSLTYVWQIEWKNYTIKDFYVNYDWEIILLNKEWVYKLNFEISDDRVILR